MMSKEAAPTSGAPFTKEQMAAIADVVQMMVRKSLEAAKDGG